MVLFSTFLVLKRTMLILLVSLPILAVGQVYDLDSLKRVAHSGGSDTAVFNACATLSHEISYDSLPEANYYLYQAISIARRLEWDDKLADCMNTLGIHHYWENNLDSAIHYYQKVIEISMDNELWLQAAATLSNQGGMFYLQGDYKKALDNYKESIRLRYLAGDTSGIASCYAGQGNIHYKLQDFESAYNFYSKAYNGYVAQEDRMNSANMLGNIAVQCKYMERYDEAIEIYLQAMALHREIDNLRGLANVTFNLSVMYLEGNELELAKAYMDTAMAVSIEADYEGLFGELYVVLGRYYVELDDCDEAMRWHDKALDYILSSVEPHFKMEGYQYRYQALKCLGRTAEALEAYELFNIYWDTVHDFEEEQQVLMESLKLNFQQALLADSLAQVQKDALHAEELKSQELKALASERLNYVFGILAVLLLGFAYFIWRGYVAKRKANKEIQAQKEIVDEKNKEITDSITYAKRIQEAILPSDQMVNEALPNNFVLYKPKDIVAGDFYWLDTQNGQTLFAVADCTGHGVPGAMVSVVCHNALNRTVREFGLTDPGQVLNKTREIVVEQFSKSGKDVKDGMDIAFCALSENGTGANLRFAGANNPLWLIRKGSEEIEEIKSTKEPIGIIAESAGFETTEVELQEGDQVYLFSDGFADQFGGPRGKKLKAKAFRDMLIRNCREDLAVQMARINEGFESWRGELEQIDDVCVMGIRI